MVILVYFHILQLPQTVISNSEKLTHPTVLYNNTVYVSLCCRFCGAWCGTIQQYCLCFSPLQGLWRLMRYCTTLLFMFLSAAGFVALMSTWRGSVTKLIYINLVVFLFLYFSLRNKCHAAIKKNYVLLFKALNIYF